MANCYCCGDDLTFGEKKKRRRLLSKSSMQGIVRTLASLVCMESNVNDIDIPKLHTGYLCRNCLELLERYQSLQQQLRSTIKAALPTLPRLPDQVEERNQLQVGCATCSATVDPIGTSPIAPVKTHGRSPQVIVSSYYWYWYRAMLRDNGTQACPFDPHTDWCITITSMQREGLVKLVWHFQSTKIVDQ